MLTLDDLPTLQRKVEELRQEKDQAEGSLRELLRRLKKEFGVGTLKEARLLLKRLEVRERKAYNRYVALKKAFEEKYADRL